MSIDDFVRHSKILDRLTIDFVRAVPDDKWDFTPGPPGRAGRTPALHRIGDGFAPFCKQLRHVVCVRGVYNAALATKKVDWTRKHEHCWPADSGATPRRARRQVPGPAQRAEDRRYRGADRLDGTPFTCALFTWEFEPEPNKKFDKLYEVYSGASFHHSPFRAVAPA